MHLKIFLGRNAEVSKGALAQERLGNPGVITVKTGVGLSLFGH